MKYLLIIFTLVIIGCKDQANKTETVVEQVRTPSICPPSGPYPDPPNILFEGISEVSSPSQTQLTVKWNPITEAKAYLIYQRVPGEDFKLVHTRNAPGSKAIIRNLEADTTYEFMVRLLDERGMPDLNDKSISATTSAWPLYANNKSLKFNGVKSLNLAPSEELGVNNTFTISLWFKTSEDNQNDARLFTFHKGSGASSAFYLAMDGNKLTLGYRNADDDFKKESIDGSYADNSWHHIAATYNGKFYVAYIDGVRQLRFKDSFIGLGSHPAHLASYTGSQKAFDGLIDEASIWKSALGSQDSVDIYNKGTPFDLRRHKRANTLQAWYRLGDDARDDAATVFDQVGSFNASPVNIRIEDYQADAP